MVSDIDFIKLATLEGVQRPNRYAIYITSPFGFGFDTAVTIRMSALCRDAELPGKGLATVDRITHGPVRKIPYQELYSDITLNFICTNSMLERRFIDRWMANIVDPRHHYFSYYDSYVSRIVITTLSEENIPTYFCILNEAYPVSIAPQSLSYDANDTYQTMSVTFAYQSWLNDEQLFFPGDDGNVNQDGNLGGGIGGGTGGGQFNFGSIFG